MFVTKNPQGKTLTRSFTLVYGLMSLVELWVNWSLETPAFFFCEIGRLTAMEPNPVEQPNPITC